MNSLLLAAALLVAQPGDTDTGRGLICDTQPQLVTVLGLRENGASLPQAIAQVNKAEGGGDPACDMTPMIAYVRGEAAGVVSLKGQALQVTHITIVGFQGEDGKWQKIDPPLEEFTVFPVEDGPGA
jgi:hypothetical protein